MKSLAFIDLKSYTAILWRPSPTASSHATLSPERFTAMPSGAAEGMPDSCRSKTTRSSASVQMLSVLLVSIVAAHGPLSEKATFATLRTDPPNNGLSGARVEDLYLTTHRRGKQHVTRRRVGKAVEMA